MKTTFALLLTSVFTTLVGKIFAALGLSITTYVVSTAIQQNLISGLQNQMNGIGGASAHIFYLAGGGIALNWFLGAVSFALTFKSVSKLGTIFSNK